MSIRQSHLKQMNDLLKNGWTIAQLAEKYHGYGYWQIYWEVSDYSFLGKKRTITNRINKLKNSRSPQEREELANQAQALITELYESLKTNSRKLIEIDRVLRE